MSLGKKYLGLLALVTSSFVHAEAVDDQKIIDLDTYTVSASKIALPVGIVGSSITVLDVEDTGRFSTEMLTESLRHVPGIYLRNNGSEQSSSGITMRGLPIAPVVLIDGVEVNNPGNGNIFNFGNLPTAIVGSVEVLRGAQSALYGANALTGVISINTKKGETIDPSAVVGMSYGSRDTTNAYATLSQANEQMNYFVSVNRYETGGFSVQDPSWGAEWADDDASESFNVMGKFEFAVTDVIDFSLFGNYSEGESEYDPGNPSPWTIPVFENRIENEQMILKAAASFAPTDTMDLTASVTFNDVVSSARDSFGQRDSEVELLKYDLLSHYQVNDFYQIVAGLDLKQASNKVGNYEMETFSLFVENLIEVTDNLNATVAFRHDDNDIFGEKNTYRSSLSYSIEDYGLQLKASVGSSFDAPEISQLFGPWGNPDLTPEDGSSYDLGFEQELDSGKLVWGVSYFCVKMEDHIEYLRSTFSYANVDWDSCGFETFVRWSVLDDLDLQLSHSFANAERKRVEDDLMFHSPEHQISLLLDKGFLDDKLNTSMTFHYVGDRETWDGATDSFITVDLAVRYQVNDNTEIWLRADNLLDEEYQEIRGYFAPGFGVFGGIKLEF